MTIVRLVALQAINLGHRTAQKGETVLTVTGSKADLDWFRRNLKWSALQHVAESEVVPPVEPEPPTEVVPPAPPADLIPPYEPPVDPDDSDDADDLEDEESEDDEAGEPATDTKAPAKRGRPGKQHRR